MKLSVIIPAYNEEGTIEEVVRRVFAFSRFGWDTEIVVVNDGSGDRTGILLERLRESLSFRLVSLLENKGKGAAIRKGLSCVLGDVVLIQDADLEYDPSDVHAILRSFEEGADIVYGSRNLGDSKRGYFPFFWGGKLLSFVASCLFRTRLTDINTGYKAFRWEVLKDLDLREDGFEFCEEVTAKVLRSGREIREVPISYRPRSFREGKKIRPIHGLRGLVALVKYRIC